MIINSMLIWWWSIDYRCYLTSVSNCSGLSPCCLWMGRNIMTLSPKHKTTTHLRLSINIIKRKMTRKYTFEWYDVTMAIKDDWMSRITLFEDSSRNKYETPQAWDCLFAILQTCLNYDRRIVSKSLGNWVLWHSV